MTTYTAQFTEATGFVRLDGDIVFTGSASGQPISPTGLAATGVAIVRGPFSFAFNTAGLTTGVTIYTPTVSDILLDAWIEVDTAFDGTTPLADIGTFSGTTSGLFKNTPLYADAIYLAAADTANSGAGVLQGTATDFKNITLSGADAVSTHVNRVVPARFTAATPLKLVVSQTGLAGGTAIGGAAGAGRVYIVTATPVAL